MREESREEKIIRVLASKDYGVKSVYQPIFRVCRTKGWSSKAALSTTLFAGAIFSGAFVWVCWVAVTALHS